MPARRANGASWTRLPLVGHGPAGGGRRPVAGAVRLRGRGGGAGGRRRSAVPAGVGEAARGAGGVVRADRDEHPGRTAAGVRGVGGGNVPEAGRTRVAATCAGGPADPRPASLAN